MKFFLRSECLCCAPGLPRRGTVGGAARWVVACGGVQACCARALRPAVHVSTDPAHSRVPVGSPFGSATHGSDGYFARGTCLAGLPPAGHAGAACARVCQCVCACVCVCVRLGPGLGLGLGLSLCLCVSVSASVPVSVPVSVPGPVFVSTLSMHVVVRALARDHH